MAARGQGQLVLLSGEAGMGKSRLVAELSRVAEGIGCAVINGSSAEGELSLPYLPFVEGISAHLAGSDKAHLREQLGDVRHELAQLFPQLESRTKPELDDPVRAKLRLFEAIVALFGVISAETGMLLVLEDIHWADASTRELLDYLVRRVPRTRWMILATYRSDEMHRRHPLVPLVQRWRRATAVESIELKPLTPPQIAQMVDAIFETGEPQPALRDLLHQRSEGNPFVLEELLKDAIDRGVLRGRDLASERLDIDQLAVPRTVLDSILLRVDRLSARDAAVLRAAAVLGRSFAYDALVAVAQASEAEVQEALETGVKEQLVEPEPQSPTAFRYRFRHALTREAIYEDMIVPQRNQLHLRAADALKQLPGTAPVDIASHLLAAGQGLTAVPVCLEAAQDAVRRRGYGEAVEIYKRVVPHLEGQPEQGTIVCQLGEALWKSGDPTGAQRYLETGTALLEAAGQVQKSAHWRLTLARCHWERARLDLAHQEYERARALLAPAGPSEDLAVVYCGLAGLHAFELNGPEAQNLAEMAIAVAGEIGAYTPLIRAYNFLGISLVFQGRIAEGIEYMDRSYSQAMERELDWNALTAIYNSIIIRLWHLRAAECPRLLERILELPSGWWRDLAHGRGSALTNHMLGNLEAALTASDQVLTLAEQGGASTFVLWARRQRAYLLAEMGQPQQALVELPARQDGEDRQELFFDYEARIRIHLALDQPQLAAEAAAIILAAGEWAQDHIVIAAAAEAFVAADQTTSAQHLLARAVADGLDPSNPYMLMSAARLDLAAGDVPAALPRLQEATRAIRASGYAMEEMRSTLMLVEALALRGDRADAQARLDAMVGMARARGAQLMEDSAKRLAQRLRLDFGARPAAARTGPKAEPVGTPVDRLSISGELRGAMRAQQLQLNYQPTMRIAGKQIERVEALIRWKHPRLGIVHPDRFIPLAEKLGLIRSLTLWALDAALGQCRAWTDKGLAVGVAVNLSTSDLDDPRFVENVTQALETRAVDASQLTLEITEGQVMANPERALQAMKGLRSLGVGLSVDDFGIGHSSLAYIRELPATEVKIDRSFCMDLDAKNMVIVRSAISMAHELGLGVIAEGVESEETLNLLAGLGCDYAQGYFIGAPQQAGAITRRLRKQALAAR
jgi:EAL domain-containing protein (putative c-di-GMP-specific phosphodiesterase class I)